MKSVREEILEALKYAVMEDEASHLQLEVPQDAKNGDFSTNIALLLAKKSPDSPFEIATDIKKKIEAHEVPSIEKIEVAGPGFINFYVSQNYLVQYLDEIKNARDTFGNSDSNHGKKVVIEFTDPNPFKVFHIGHLYTNAIGESLSRLYESQGSDVTRVCYQGDVGMHVAKSVYGLLQISNSKFQIANVQEFINKLEEMSLDERIKLLGEAYALGATEFETNETAKEEINRLNKAIYERSDEEINHLYDTGKKWSLEHFDEIYARLGTKFQKFYFESEAAKRGLEIVKKNIGEVFQESEGAVIFPGEDFGLHNRVFINSMGLPTYEAKELGLAPWKYEDFKYDESIIVTGNEINAYFQVLLRALSQTFPDLADKTAHIGHGMVRLPEGKMSSRTGNVISGEWLLDEAKNQITTKYTDMDEATAEMVAVAAVKYALLKSGVGKDIAFSFDESISLEGNSGPYLQYTYVRTKSILNKSEDRKQKAENEIANRESKIEIEEQALLRQLLHFPDTVAAAQASHSPSTVATYLFELAQKFNAFYQLHQVVGNEFRLSLTESVGIVLQNGLNLLGIKTPEKM